MDISAVDEAHIADVRSLLLEYAGTLPFPLDFQEFDTELAQLPGDYAPPGGALLIARDSGRAVGCVALRPLDPQTCEMKRLYVRAGHRGGGFGRALATAIMAEGKRLGYRSMRLDTVPGMDAAQSLYEQLGFRVIAPYTLNPVPGVRFLELGL
jgi:ribosomal protein S18 acetylase RimI-like enzyme